VGGYPLSLSQSETGPRFTVGIKKIGSNRSSHSEFLTCIERWKKIMAQELTDEQMNQQMDQHEEAVSITCTLCKKVILRTEICCRTKCCRYHVHFDCFVRALDEQLVNKGGTHEKLHCTICHTPCILSMLLASLDK